MAVMQVLFSGGGFFLFQECEKKEQMINKVKYKNVAPLYQFHEIVTWP